MTRRRLRKTVPDLQPRATAPEGQRAAWWREHRLHLSRPAIAERLGLEKQTIARYEAMSQVPAQYKLACAALAAKAEFDWDAATVTVGTSRVTI